MQSSVRALAQINFQLKLSLSSEGREKKNSLHDAYVLFIWHIVVEEPGRRRKKTHNQRREYKSLLEIWDCVSIMSTTIVSSKRDFHFGVETLNNHLLRATGGNDTMSGRYRGLQTAKLDDSQGAFLVNINRHSTSNVNFHQTINLYNIIKNHGKYGGQLNSQILGKMLLRQLCEKFRLTK